MPLKGDAKSVHKSMVEQYGKEKGESIFYATANKQKRVPETWKKKASVILKSVLKKNAEVYSPPGRPVDLPPVEVPLTASQMPAKDQARVGDGARFNFNLQPETMEAMRQAAAQRRAAKAAPPPAEAKPFNPWDDSQLVTKPRTNAVAAPAVGTK
jgi:hypothetical protein